jgi:hypothetical protein
MIFKLITRLVLALALGLVFSASAWGQNAFFTQTFAGGIPSGWTTPVLIGNNQPSSAWRHTTTGAAGGFAIGPLQSTTASNGWMIFDSDLNCNHPTGQDAWLISPAIDGSDYEAIWLQFETFYASFNDRPQIRVGTDLNNLDSWAIIEVFPGIRANEFGGIIVGDEGLNPQIINVNLTPFAAGVNGFRFAFQFLSISSTANGGNLTGCAYSWHVDDVKLLDENPTLLHNISVSRPRLAPNFAQPATQIDTVRMAALVRNFGQLSQTNLAFTASIAGDNGDSFSTTEFLAELEPDSSVFFFMDERFLPSGQGIYTLTYSAEADSIDQQPENNTLSSQFIITENLFAKDNGELDFPTGPSEVVDETWEVGNYYYVPNGGFEAYEASFSIFTTGNTHQGRSVNVFLYEVDEDDNPNFTDEDVNVVGFATYNFTTEVNRDLITVELTDLISGEAGIELKAGGEYLLMIEYQPDMAGVFSDMPMDYDVATVVKNGGWFLGGFTGDAVVVARMRIRSIQTSVGQVELAKANIELFPNPANEAVNAKIELETLSSRMEVRVLNMMGQPINRQVFDNTMGETVRFDVRQYPAGTYFFQILTDEGVKTQRFAVQR